LSLIFVNQFNQQVCFSLVNLIHKITNKKEIIDVYAILIYFRLW